MRIMCRKTTPVLALGIFALAVPPLPAATERDAQYSGARLTVESAGSKESPTAGIQEAIDRLPRQGGTVHVPAGEYMIRCSISLPDNVTLEGSGTNTVFVRPPLFMSALARANSRNTRTIVVTNATGFARGCGVFIFDDNHRDWAGASVRVADIQGNKLVLDRPLTERYLPERHACAANLYPFIIAPQARDVVIRNLAIDGRRHESPAAPPGFVYSAIHLHNVRNGLVENCTIRNHMADGLSVQNGEGTVVRDCLSEDNNGNGFHPGTLLRNATFENNRAFRNGHNGLYFCAGVERSKVVGNEFRGNMYNGIGGLGDYGDRDNLVLQNVCRENGRSGIEVIGGSANRILRNECANNSVSAPGRYAGITVRGATNCTIAENECFDSRAEPTQWVGVDEDASSKRNIIQSNRCPAVHLKGP